MKAMHLITNSEESILTNCDLKISGHGIRIPFLSSPDRQGYPCRCINTVNHYENSRVKVNLPNKLIQVNWNKKLKYQPECHEKK